MGIEHPEDLLFTQGLSGARSAVYHLINLGSDSHDLSIKWDGMPALVFGHNDLGNLVLTDKHMYEKISTGKMPWMSIRAYDQHRGVDRRDLWTKEDTLIKHLGPMIPSGNSLFRADLLWTGPVINDLGMLRFTPNTVSYHIAVDSPVGSRISGSIAGLAMHGYIPQTGHETPFNEKHLREFTPGQVMLLSGDIQGFDSKVKDDRYRHIELVLERDGAAVDLLINGLKGQRLGYVISAMRTYITHKLKIGRDRNEPFHRGFLEHLMVKLHDVQREKARAFFADAAHMDALERFWHVWQTIEDLKHHVKSLIDQHIDQGPHIIKAHINGKIGHEGYVVKHADRTIKLVDRWHFSAANFAKHEPPQDEMTTKASMPRAAFCFGRMNPPTRGHKQLVDRTIEEGGENAFVFLSTKQNNKTDPLTHSAKVEWVKALWPEHARHIVEESISNPIQAANWLYDRGYRNITLVAGSDRLGSGTGSIEQLLTNWNSGPIRTTDHARGPAGRDHVVLSFSSSGDRDDTAQGIKGFSGTKARTAAKRSDENEFIEMTGASGSLMVNNRTLYQETRIGMKIDEDKRT